MMTDENCLSLLNTGDPSAFRYLMVTWYPVICQYAERILKDRPVAEDMAEESFIKLWGAKKEFSSIQSVKKFLYLTTRNACINVLRSNERLERRHKEYSVLHSGEDNYALNEIIRAEVLSEISRAVAQLPPRIRDVFTLSFIEGMKNQEIAKKLNTSVNTVKNQKVRALQLLRLSLKDKSVFILILLLNRIYHD